MKKFLSLLVLASTSILALSGCNEKTTPIEPEPEVENRGSWSDEAKVLLNKYCGEVIPFPLGFSGDVSVQEKTDDEDNKYLLIVNEAKEFTINDYYKDLQKAGWDGITDYEGNLYQETSNGNKYYEFTNISQDKTKGYDLKYYFSTNSESKTKYNVIQCYNDLSTTTEDKSSWTDKEKEMFNETITCIPAKFKLGLNSEVYAYSEDFIYAYDTCAINLTNDNVKILQDDGWTIDTHLSKNNKAYTLRKDVKDNAIVYAKVYYNSRNFVTFSYEAQIKVSDTWPSAFVSSFETKNNFTIPAFEDITVEEYYYYTKNNISYIYAYTEDSDFVYQDYSSSMNDTTAIFDNLNRLYTDWEEKWYIKPEEKLDYTTEKKIFRISFGELKAPIDEMVTSYPTQKINDFITTNELGEVTIPTFDFTSLSTYNSYRLETVNYADAYKEEYNNIKEDPDGYDIMDPTDEEEIVARAKELAKEDTLISIKIYDKADSTTSSKKVYDYLETALTKIGWARVNNYSYNIAYENAKGNVLLGVTHYNDVTTLTYTYGSGETHDPAFYFATTNYSIEVGGTLKLNLVCDMLSGTITYTSSNSKFTVDENGVVTASNEAVAGDSTTITASILADGETEPRTTTCFISIPSSYTPSNTIAKVAELYNDYFNLTSEDSGYATPDSDNSFTVYPNTITSVDELKSTVMDNFIPTDFFNGDETEWYTDSDSELGDYEYMEYTAYNEDDSAVMLTFKAFTNASGSIGLNVVAEDW